MFGLTGMAVLLMAQRAAAEVPAGDLARLSLAQLSKLEVTSVSKSAQPLLRSAATIYVITREQILRSGATSLPEALRLAPNLTVTQSSSTAYTVSARGFSGNVPDQNFSNKLLILIDGRSVYTPLFSGVYLDAQDVVLEDIDRIEVISGPGSTLWGANAMNGVINIVTRASYLTQGTLLSGAAGNQEQELSARYGGSADEGLTYRVYGKDFQIDALQFADGSSAHDGWTKGQGGFRADWTRTSDSVTVQGDLYRGTQQQPNAGDTLLLGGNLL